MIQEIINKGHYTFKGDLHDFKHCVSSFKITKVICIGEVLGIKICEVHGKFKYHGDYHKVYISKRWGEENILSIQYLGGYHERS